MDAGRAAPSATEALAGEASLRRLHESGLAQLERMIDAAWQQSDRELLELCRRRMAQLLRRSEHAEPVAITSRGVELPRAKREALPDWDASADLTRDEKAHLALCEQFVTNVSHVSDGQIETLRRVREEKDVYSFVSSLYVIELAERLVLALGRAGRNDGEAQ